MAQGRVERSKRIKLEISCDQEDEKDKEINSAEKVAKNTEEYAHTSSAEQKKDNSHIGRQSTTAKGVQEKAVM